MSEINHTELLRRLRRLAKALREQCESINHGGCGVVAAEVGACLMELGVPVEVVTPHTPGVGWRGEVPARVRAGIIERWGLDPAEAEPDEWDAAGLWRTHLALRFQSNGKTYTWDSEGTVHSAHWFGKLYIGGERVGRYWHRAGYEFGQGMTIPECANISKGAVGWNSRFDRRQVPTIRALAREFLQGV